jgi:hypothetical protein
MSCNHASIHDIVLTFESYPMNCQNKKHSPLPNSFLREFVEARASGKHLPSKPVIAFGDNLRIIGHREPAFTLGSHE